MRPRSSAKIAFVWGLSGSFGRRTKPPRRGRQIKLRDLWQLEIKRSRPCVFVRRQLRQRQELHRADAGDVKQSQSLLGFLPTFASDCAVETGRDDIADAPVQSIVAAAMDKLRPPPCVGRHIDRNGDWPFQSFRAVHCHELDRLPLGVHDALGAIGGVDGYRQRMYLESAARRFGLPYIDIAWTLRDSIAGNMRSPGK